VRACRLGQRIAIDVDLSEDPVAHEIRQLGSSDIQRRPPDVLRRSATRDPNSPPGQFVLIDRWLT